MPGTFFIYAWAGSWERLAMAAAVTLVFALGARVVRGVSWSGAAGGALACFAIFAGAGPGGFATLVALFLLTSLSTRAGYKRKADLGVAERREGRNARQVLANLLAASVCCVAFAATGKQLWVVAFVAALTEAATDTVASEIGQARRAEARMITTWARVPSGVDGGVTIPGTVAGAMSGLMTAAVAAAGGVILWRELWIALAAGYAGMIVDSLLGATIQRRGWISNHGVNLVSTVFAAVLGYGIGG